MPKIMEILGPLAALGASLTWVAGSSVYTLLAKKYSASTINFTRASIAFPLFILVCLFRMDEILPTIDLNSIFFLENICWLILSVLATYCLGDFLFIWSALSVGYPTSQAVGAIYPLWAAIFGVIFLEQPLNIYKYIGIILSILGIVAVVYSGRNTKIYYENSSKSLLRHKSTGVLLAIATSVAWAINGFAVHKAGTAIPVVFGNVIRMGFAALVCFAIIKFKKGEKSALFLQWSDFKKYGLIFAVESFGGSFLFLYGMSHTPLALGATLSSLAPVIAVPVAVFMRWERFSLLKSLGILIVMFGVTILVCA